MTGKKIYAHYLDDKCFYVGCGSADRPYDFVRRNINWKTVVGSRKPTVVILDEKEDETEALACERYHIQRMKDAGMVLANKPAAQYWLGKARDPDLMRRMSAASQSPESKAKRYAGRKGSHLSEAHRAAIKEGSPGKRAVICSDGMRFESINDAARRYGLTCGRVSEVVNGKRKSANGLRFSLEAQ